MTNTKQLTCPECGGVLQEAYAEANYGRVLLIDQCQGCGGVWFDRWELYFVTDEAIKNLEGMDAGSFVAPVEARQSNGLCPKCERELAVFTDPNLPKDALIERCPNCSGLWLNRGELGKYAAHRKAFRAARPEYKTAELDTLMRHEKELELDNIDMQATMELAAKLQQDEPPLNSKDIAFLALGLCPRCQKGLVVFTDPNLPKDAVVERCPGCNSLWLNRGELGKYAAHRKAFRAERPECKAAELDTLKHLQKALKLDNIATPTTTELASKLQQDEELPINSREVAKDIAFLALQSLIRLVFKF